MTVGPAPSRHLGKFMCILSKLHSVKLNKVKLDEKFFSALSDSGSKAQVRLRRRYKTTDIENVLETLLARITVYIEYSWNSEIVYMKKNNSYMIILGYT